MEYALEFDKIEKQYKGFSLEPTSFVLPRGYIMGLIGPNGAGKTTLIKLALNLVRSDGGAIRLFGLDHRLHEKEVRSRIGYVPDEPRFHDDIALKYLKASIAPFYPDWSETRFRELAGEFSLPMEKKFKKLSHGTKSKFALALALAHRPELLILDEPTAGLDPAFRNELLGLLSEILQDDRISVLVSTHITSDLEKTADFITFVRDGRHIFTKPKDEILEGYSVVRGGREGLNEQTRSLFEGIRLRAHAFEALTRKPDEARRCFGDEITVDRATLEDVMVLMERSWDHAA